jgi:hypothetical protein
MMTPTRIVRTIGIIGLVGWIALVGWVAKSTLAQNAGQNPAPLPSAADTSDLPPVASEPPRKQNGGDAIPLPVAPDSGTNATTDQSPSSHPPLPASPGSPEPADSTPPLPGSRRLPAPSDNQPATSSNDPEQSAQAFVERNQKEAEDHLKALTAEAHQLRARLTKLESGIRKWQALVNALRSSQGQPIASTPGSSAAADAGDLEPIRPARAGSARADRRVKWATAAPAAGGGQPGDRVEPFEQQPAMQPRPLQVVVPGTVPR